MVGGISLSFWVNTSEEISAAQGSPPPMPRPLQMPLINLKQTRLGVPASAEWPVEKGGEASSPGVRGEGAPRGAGRGQAVPAFSV